MKAFGRFINGDRIAEVADVVFGSRYQDVLNRKELHSALKAFAQDVAIVYMDTHLANQFFDSLEGVPGARLIIITHNGDGSVQQFPQREIDADFNRITPAVFRWFAQNIEVDDPRLTPIPIGLERPIIDPAARKEYQIRRRKRLSSPKRHFLYMNHDISTNTRERAWLYERFLGMPWVFPRSAPPGVPYSQYLDDLSASYFCLSPPGNGLDCHRTWEALYRGCYPVVKRSIMSERLYSELPVVLVDDYEEVTEFRLRQELERLGSRTTNVERIFLEYYHREILAATSKAGSRVSRPVPRASWGEKLQNIVASRSVR